MERTLSVFPNTVLADELALVFGIAHGKLHIELLIAKRAQHKEGQVKNTNNLVHQLIGPTKDVRVVLGKPADTKHAMKDTASFVAIDRAQLAPAHWQVAIGARLGLEHQHRERAVHGFEQVLHPIDVNG